MSGDINGEKERKRSDSILLDGVILREQKKEKEKEIVLILSVPAKQEENKKERCSCTGRESNPELFFAL